MSAHVAAPALPMPSYLEATSGLWSWLTTTDHKRIGILYLIGMMVFFLFAAAMAITMRLELFAPGEQLISADVYNRVLTLHGVSSSELVVPVNTPVKAELRAPANDVLHSFYLPDFRVKEDVVPGRVTYLWFEAEREGVYNIFCAEFCGKDHSRMLALLRVVGPEEYAEWIRRQKLKKLKPLEYAGIVDPEHPAFGPEGLDVDGAALYGTFCASCHGERGDGSGLPGVARDFRAASGWKRSSKVTDVYRTLTEGIPGTQMRAWPNFTPWERVALAHHVRLLVGDAAPADSEEDYAALVADYELDKVPELRETIPIERAIDILVEEARVAEAGPWDLLELTKVRITIAVTLTTATGYFLAAGRVDWGLGLTLVGIFLLAAGSSAFNHVQEAKIDARMKRTRNRPIPSGRVRPAVAFFVAGLLVLLGFFVLASLLRNVVVVLALGGLALVWYNGVYTYLKRLTAFAVIPGALIGAIPPLIGWAAAGGALADPIILLVAAFFFIWQIPHFWLLLLRVGDEYAAAGLPTLTRTFSRPQLARITFIWVLATAAAGVVFPAVAHDVVTMPWSLALILASVWLTVHATGVLRRPKDGAELRPFWQAFLQINVYALMVMVCLSLSGLGVAWH